MDAPLPVHSPLPEEPLQETPLNLANLAPNDTLQLQHIPHPSSVPQKQDPTNSKVLPVFKGQETLAEPTDGKDPSDPQQQQNHQQPQPQPQQYHQQEQQQQEPQQPHGQYQQLDPEKNDPLIQQSQTPATTEQMSTPGVPSTGTRPLGFANLVNRVRLNQQQQHVPSETSGRTTPARDSRVLDPEKASQQHDDRRGVYFAKEQRPSIFHNSIETDSHDGARSSASGSHHWHRPHRPKIFTKEGVRNVLLSSSAATAFSKSSRSKTMENIDVPMASLAVTSSAVPALWLRRDDKGRRPPPVLFPLLKINVSDSEIDVGVSKQIVFRVELQYGDVKWVIRRTLYEFYKLHLVLTAKGFDNLPKFPSQMSYAFSLAKASLGMKAEEKVAFVREANLSRRQALQTYLLQTLGVLNLTVAYDLYEFMEISALSLTKDMGWKGKEAYVETRVIDRSCTVCGIGKFSRWVKSWALLRDSYLAFAPSVGSYEPSDVFIFDRNFFVQHKEHALGLNLHHIEIGNTHRRIEIRGEHNREMLEWMDHFCKMQKSSPWVNTHRYGSFAPQRSDAKVRYYVDGKDYFHAVSDAILAAKSEIYICDWWLSPELYLRRPPEKNEEFRLDRLLKKKAMEGVMIYIVVYKEVALALSLDSAHTKIWLQDLHSNIQVQRHPDHLTVNATQFWAHHEKICVVDCRLAFIGGLDLCFGRYDSRTHQLADYHPSGIGGIWPGQDYSNPRIKDFVNVKNFNNDLLEKRLIARMPWHDVSVGMAGQPARDIARHFVERWNFVKREKGMKKSHMKFITPKGEFVSTRNETGWTGSQKVQIVRSSTNWSQGVDMERSIQDAYLSNIENAEHFIYIENQFFVTLAVENGNPELKNTIGLALVNRIIRAHTEGKKFRVIVVMPLMPAFEADIMSSEAGTLRKVMHFQYVSISRGGNSVLERLVANGIDPEQYIGFFGLRSFDRIKHGKFDAIVEAVKEAERRERARTQTTPSNAELSKAPTKDSATELNEKEGHPKGSPTNEKSAGIEADGPKLRSLASKFLLEPIPRGEEAARIVAIAEQRKEEDARRTWDESIAKKAMNPAKKEHGYVPAATENSLEDSHLNAQIKRETDKAEIDAEVHHHRGSTTNSTPQLLDGLGTMMRTAIENLKGNKEGGDLEPMHRRVSRRHFHRHHGMTGDEGDDADSIDLERQSDKDDAESIVEPKPESSEDSQQQEPGPGEEEEVPAREGPLVEDEVDDFVTEQLYIHSKLMIVDDRIIICGSANINDRSQVGFRDSEIAIVIEDTHMVPSRMNGEPYQAGKLAHALRTDLFKEHLGLLAHVEHDVVTKGSVLPVDLDAPNKDPEQARLELIAKAHSSQEEERSRQEEHYRQQHQFLQVPAGGAQPALDSNQQDPRSQQPLQPAFEGSVKPQDQDALQQEPQDPHQQQQQQQQQQPQQWQNRFGYNSVPSSPHHEKQGHLKSYFPDEEEAQAINQWHSSSPPSSTAPPASVPNNGAPIEGYHQGIRLEPMPASNPIQAIPPGPPVPDHGLNAAKRAAAEDPEVANDIVCDPLHDSFYQGWWCTVAKTNTEIFREVFRCVPDDSVETWTDYQEFVPDPKKVIQGHVAMPNATIENVTERLKKVTGHLVQFPTRFLRQENLMGGVVQGKVVPMEIFT